MDEIVLVCLHEGLDNVMNGLMGMFPKQTTMIETWRVCYDIKEGMMV